MQATSGEKPFAWAIGDWAHLMQATSGWAPLVWAEGNGWLRMTWCLLHDLQVAGTDCGSHLGGQREAWPDNLGPMIGLHLRPQSPQGLAKKKKKNGYSSRLPPPRNTSPCSCHCQMLWRVPRHLITLPSQDPTTRSSWCSTSSVG